MPIECIKIPKIKKGKTKVGGFSDIVQMCSCPFRTFSSPLAAPDAASELDFQTDIRRQPSSCLTRFKIGFAPACAPPAPPAPTFSRRFQIGFSDKNLSFPFPSAAQMGFASSLTRSPKENFNRQDSTHAHTINWINLEFDFA